MKIQSILIIHGFCICEFAYLLKLTCHLQSILTALSWSFTDMPRAVKSLSSLMFAAETEQGDCLPLCFSSPSVNQHPSRSRFSATGFALWGFLLVILLLKMAPKHSAEMFSSIPKCKAVKCLPEKIYTC